jgi:hypothetical protein
MDHDDSRRGTPIEPGVAVYDDEGDELGVVTGMTDEGFEVSIDGEPPAQSEQEHEPGQTFGEGYLMWRCDDCGEMGDLDDGLPTTCPDCGSEAVYKWRED